MSLTSYRAAPPRVTKTGGECAARRVCVFRSGGRSGWLRLGFHRDAKRALAALLTGPCGPETVNGFFLYPRALMPGDDLLFQRLSVSTIGAVRFHGRVRDGIGWVTDAMATKQ